MSISISSNLDHERMHKISFQSRRDSSELDVFEAARYFSGFNEAILTSFPQKGTRGRMSLDMPIRNAVQMQSNAFLVDNKQIVKEISKKYKQPSSPGGKLASFLNSLFSQNGLKKKKSKSVIVGTTKSIKDHHHNDEDLRRKRRSSMSHITSSSSSNANDSSTKSFYYSSSSSGIRTPPPIYANTPTKGYVKDFKSYTKKSNFSSDDKFNFKNSATLLEKNEKMGGINNFLERNRNWVDRYSSEKKEFKVFTRNDDYDDGAESDSSSDLFELQNCDLGGNLPVYETTNLDRIKRSAPISNL